MIQENNIGDIFAYIFWRNWKDLDETWQRDGEWGELLLKFLARSGLNAVVFELQKNKRGGLLYPSFPQHHGPYGEVKISEGPGKILWLPCNSITVELFWTNTEHR